VYSRVRHDGIHVPVSHMYACTYANRVLSSLMSKTRQIRVCEGDSRVPKKKHPILVYIVCVYGE